MGTNYIRIDDRLIHGQIVARWSKHLNINDIIVIDDKTASNSTLKSIMAMSVPKQYKTTICTMAEFQDVVEELNNKDENNLIIMRFPYLVEEVLKTGIDVVSINIGNVSKRDNESKEIIPNIYLSKEDIEVIEKLYTENVQVFFQLVPDSQNISWDKARKNIWKIK